MFSHEKLQKPKTTSLILTLIVAAAAFYIQQISAVGGYLLALLALVLIFVVSVLDVPWWPNKKTPENPIIFSLLWGLMIGILLPFLFSIFTKDGFKGIFQMFMA